MNMMTSGRPIEILLVEDSPGDVRLTQEALSEAKVRNTLHIARDGEQALDFLYCRNGYANAVRPDLILLDLNLPKKDGREVLSEVKSNEQLHSIPVVVLTTSQADQDIFESYNLNANCYITKPIDLTQFIEVIRVIEEFWLTVVKLPKA